MLKSEIIRVCIGGANTQDFPLQPMATPDTLRNIYIPGHPTMPQAVIDAYNQYTRDINAATWLETRNGLLDRRHQFYVFAMESQKEACHAQG